MRNAISIIRYLPIAAVLIAMTGVAIAAGAPALPDATKVKENAKGDGTHFYYTSKKSAKDLVDSYKSVLESDGWTIDSSGAGGSSWGGDGGLTATKGSEYLVMSAGGETGDTNIDLCVWPSKPKDDNC